jgi:hypothetical protein
VPGPIVMIAPGAWSFFAIYRNIRNSPITPYQIPYFMAI